MKKKLYQYLILTLVSVFSLSFAGCGDDITELTEVTEVIVDGPRIHNEYVPVTWDMWTWNEESGRYEYYLTDFKELTKAVYDNGTITGSVFMNPKETNEWLELLPCAYTYSAEDNEGNFKPYTTFLSCAFQPGSVGFFMQPSDLLEGDLILNDKYEFKVSLIWYEE